MPAGEESDIDSPRESPTLMKNEVTTNFGHDGLSYQPSISNRKVIVVPSIQVDNLLKDGEYLKNYENWSSYREDKTEFTPSFIKKQNMIWELTSGERNYLEHLYVLKKVYRDKIPIGEIEKEIYFPHLDRMIELHAKLFKRMLTLHKENNGTVPCGIGSVFIEEIDEDIIESFQNIYGEFSYAYSNRLQNFAKSVLTRPEFSDFLQYVQSHDPDYKRGLGGYMLIINQRWTKVEPLLLSIKNVTLENEHELDELETAKGIVSSILSGAQEQMMRTKNYDILKNIRNKFKQRPEQTTNDEFKKSENWIIANLERYDVSLQNSDYIKVMKGSKYYEAFAVAIDTGFFVLTPGPDIYNLLMVEDQKRIHMIWGNDKPIFRTTERQPLQFILIFQNADDLNYHLYNFECNTQDECIRWNKVIQDGLQRLSMDMTSIEEDFRANQNRIHKEHLSNLEAIQILDKLDQDLLTVISCRDSFLQTFFQNEFLRTIEDIDLSKNRKSLIQVVRTSSGSSIRASAVSKKPPISSDYPGGDNSKTSSRSSSSTIDLRRKSCNNEDVSDINIYCAQLVQLIQDRRPIPVYRSSSNVEEKNRDYRSEGKSKSKLGQQMFRSGSRDKNHRKCNTDEITDIELDSNQGLDESTLRERLLFCCKRINIAVKNITHNAVLIQGDNVILKEENFHLKKENEIFMKFKTNVLKNVTCEKCRYELENADDPDDILANPVNQSRSFNHYDINSRFVEVEKLRTNRENFEREKKDWERKRQQEKAALERDMKKINQEKEELNRKKERMDNEQKLLDEEKEHLQFQFDRLNNSNGRAPVEPSVAERRIPSDYYTPEELDNLTNQEYYTSRVASIASLDDLPETLRNSKLNISKSISHARPSMNNEKITSHIPSHLAKDQKKKKLFKGFHVQ